MGTAIKHHPVPDRVKPSFVIFDIRALWRSALSVRVPASECRMSKITNDGLTRFGIGSLIAVGLPTWQQCNSRRQRAKPPETYSGRAIPILLSLLPLPYPFRPLSCPLSGVRVLVTPGKMFEILRWRRGTFSAFFEICKTDFFYQRFRRKKILKVYLFGVECMECGCSLTLCACENSLFHISDSLYYWDYTKLNMAETGMISLIINYCKQC